MLDRLLAGADVAVMVQGATGRTARRHIALMQGHGTRIVAGVAPRSDAAEVDGLPIFSDCGAARAATGAEVSLLMVPPMAVLAAATEALEAGIGLLVTVTEGIPIRDLMHLKARVREHGAEWIGASSPGLAIPGRCKLGFLPEVCLARGPVAIWSKSGTLSYEVGLRLVKRGLGQSAWIGVGGDPVKGTRFADLVDPFRIHDATRAILIVGEIGGTEEEDLAERLSRSDLGKPVFAIIAGSAAPEGKTMGHAGAIIAGGRGSFQSKSAALRHGGVQTYSAIEPLIEAVCDAVKETTT